MMDIEKIAAVCHAANRQLCLALGDDSQVSWSEAPWSLRQSAIAGVAMLQENPDAPLNFVHENWRKFKAAQGWVYGAEKNDETKTHPCMVPYEELPPEQQVKDKLFKAIVIALTQGEKHV